MWSRPDIVYQPRPRSPNPTFSFIRPQDTNPRAANAASLSLPTPSNTPPSNANSKGTHLSIPELVENDAHFGGSNILGRALDVFHRHAAENAVLTLAKEEDGEYLLSARPHFDGVHRAECEDLWAELDRAEEPDPPPECTPRPLQSIGQQRGLAYLTPPSSPENAPTTRVDKMKPASTSGSRPSPIPETEPPELEPVPCFNLDDPSPKGHSGSSSECATLDEPVTNESLEYLSDCDEFDWSYDDDEEMEDDECSIGEGNDDKMDVSSNETDEPMSPPPPYMHHPDPREFASFPKDLPDLTTSLDMASFSEWPVARGGFGDVWKGALSGEPKGKSVAGGTTRPVAVKRLTMYADAGEEGARKIMKRTARELFIWSRLHHANVLPLLGTCNFRGGVGIVSEWQENGNATAWVKANPHVNRLELCKGICAGLEYLHQSNVIHGDLRGANVLISPCGAPRLIDFGLASVVGNNPAFSASATMAGTVRWMAPELQVTEGQSTTASSDMFAFGMTMLELHTGQPPFAAVRNDIAVLLKYQRGERPPRPTPNVNRLGARRRGGKKGDVCIGMDDETWDVAQECWAQDPGSRPCVKKVLEWLIRKTRLK